jgi:UDP-galactopyranose mutase
VNAYDYLIVGSGLFGSVFAHEMHKRGKKCLVIDRRKHIGGNVYTEKKHDIQVHMYGAHIFHTHNKKVWDYVQLFAQFNHYINSPMAKIGDEIYNLPFNMNTFSKMWGVITPTEALDKLNVQREQHRVESPSNLEEQALALVGRDIYEKLIKGYTEKQWGRNCSEFTAFSH